MFQRFSFDTRHLLLLVVLGTLVRALYGAYAKAWLGAPDQLAWELGLREMLKSGDWSYKQLAHYPHEGGSALLGLFALLFTSFSNAFPALSVTALLFDTGSRVVQCLVAKKLFGNKTALVFSLWLLFPVPLLLSWSTVNLGLHHLSSFWPFLFLLALAQFRGTSLQSILIGLLSGAAMAFSYNSVIFMPAFAISLFFSPAGSGSKISSFLLFLLGFGLALTPHILLRVLVDTGFQLEHLSATNIREFSPVELLTWPRLKHLLLVGVLPLPASFFLSSGGTVLSLLQHAFVLLLIGISVVVFFKRLPAALPHEKRLLVILLLYLIVYALSPFYAGSPRAGSYYYYRHLAYVLPLLMLFIVHELQKLGKIRELLLVLYLVISFMFSAVYTYTTTPPARKFVREEGWILGRKYGDNPIKILALQDCALQQEQEELMLGFGWGTAAALFSNKTVNDSSVLNEYFRIYQNYPPRFRFRFYSGTRIAFQKGITPVLDTGFLPIIEKKFNTFNSLDSINFQ